MKQKLIEYLENQPSSYNKNATRYLYKRNPELWKWILEQTSFLPDTAKPKQRIWHILNEIYAIPLCPIDKVPVKWYENRYLEYNSLSAKAKSEKVRDKRMATYKQKTGFDSWNSKSNLEGYEKWKSTCFENWNGNWPSEDNKLSQKILETKIKNGICRNSDEISLLEKYMYEVEEHTKNNWYYFYNKINPKGKDRGKDYHLDHIYSRKEGFDNNIPPEIIGHWTNLRLIPARENNGKSSRCDKTIEQLYEDYKNNIES
jgi:hypothetical protein